MRVDEYRGVENRGIDIGSFKCVDDYDRHRLLFYKIHHYLIDKCVGYEPDKYKIQDCAWGFHSYVVPGEKTMKETIVEGFDLVYDTEVTDEDYEEAYEQFKHLLDIQRFPKVVVDWADFIVRNNIKNEYSSNREIFTKCVRQECENIMEILSRPIQTLEETDNYFNHIEENKGYRDSWGDIIMWFDGVDVKRNFVGVEYNFCIDGDENCSAFYLMFDTEPEIENEYYDGYYIYTLTDYCEHYEIDFNDSDWREKTKAAAYNAICELTKDSEIERLGYVYI